MRNVITLYELYEVESSSSSFAFVLILSFVFNFVYNQQYDGKKERKINSYLFFKRDK